MLIGFFVWTISEYLLHRFVFHFAAKTERGQRIAFLFHGVHHAQPTPFMLPFNVIGELSRTMALAVRLFGNMMSGAMIAAILLLVTPFFFPIVMTALGLLTGMIQAYIFFILATVYIAAATTVSARRETTK